MAKQGFPDHRDPVQNTQYTALVWLILAGVIGVILYLTYYYTERKKSKEKKSRAPVAQAPEPIRPVAGGRRPRRMRVREEDDFDRFDVSDDDVPVGFDDDKADGKIGAKKQRKLEMKAEKRAERQAELEDREERKKREAALAVERKKDEEKQKQMEAEKAELERQQKEEQEKREHEEYLKLKEAFTIEDEGETGILTEEESQALLQEFIDYIQKKKVLLLEELAAHFNLKTQEAIDRITNLQEMGRLTECNVCNFANDNTLHACDNCIKKSCHVFNGTYKGPFIGLKSTALLQAKESSR